MNLKTCAKCNQNKPASLEEFGPAKQSKDGLNSWCRLCVTEYRKSYAPGPKLLANKADHKICRKCVLEKHFNDFHENKKLKSGLSSWCKQCTNEYQKQYQSKLSALQVPKTGAEKTKLPKAPKIVVPKRPKDILPDGHKRCTKCKEIKQASPLYFCRTTLGKYGLNSVCKVCMAYRGKTYREANKEKIKQKYQEKKRAEGRINKCLIPVPEPTHLVCSDCKIEKLVSEFPIKGKKKNGNILYRTTCRPCHSERVKLYRALHPEKVVEWDLKREQRRKAKNPPKQKLIAKEGYKFCSKCKIEKEATLEYFSRLSKKNDSVVLSSWCRQCANEYLKSKRPPTKYRWSDKEGYKICRLCDQELPLDNFRLQKRMIRGKPLPYHVCKACESEEGRIKRRKNPEKYKEIARRASKKIKLKLEANPILKEEKLEKHRNKYKTDQEFRKKQLIKGRKFRKTDKYKQYKEATKEQMNKYYKEKKKNDPLFKLSCLMRSRVRHALKRGSFRKSLKLEQYLGCSIEFLKSHLESLFSPGMTWENHGLGEDKWHIDHIIPLSSATSAEEIYKLNHYTNLQPLWQPDNLFKSDNYPGQKY